MPCSGCSSLHGVNPNLKKREQNLRRVAKLLYIFLATPDEGEKYVESNCCYNCVHHFNVEILNRFDPELQLINTKPLKTNENNC